MFLKIINLNLKIYINLYICNENFINIKLKNFKVISYKKKYFFLMIKNI